MTSTKMRTAQDILDIVESEVKAMADRVTRIARLNQEVPGSISKKIAERNLNQLWGGRELALRVFGGVENLPEGLLGYISRAWHVHALEWGRH